MTANHIISDIKNIATSGSNPIDFRISDRQIAFWIDEFRATLISQALDKRQDVSDIWIQPISCLSLVSVDKSECCEVTTDCEVLRTELQLPNTIESKGDNTILRVVAPNGDLISKTTVYAVPYSGNSKYVKNKNKWYLKNGYIYIINEEPVLLDYITVYGIWDTPSDLTSFTACDGGTCYSYTDNYPCSKRMAETITDMVLKKKVYPFIQLPQDTTNNSNNSPDSQANLKGLQ